MKLQIKITNIETEQETEYNVGLVWGTGAFEECEEMLGIDLDEIDRGILFGKSKILNSLAYCAIVNWCKNLVDPIDVPFSYKQFIYWLDKAPQDTAKKMMDDYLNSSYQGRTTKDYYDDMVERLNKLAGGETKQSAAKKKSPQRAK